nr:MAG TPA: hypothetical protein [Caudoviricetes sp.]
MSGCSDTYLISASNKSVIRTFSPFANYSSVSSRGLIFPDAISAIVDFGTPVRIEG